MQAHDRERLLHLRRPARSQLFAGLGICGLLAIAVLGGVALAQSGRSGQSAGSGRAAPAQPAAEPIRLPARTIGGPSIFGYLVYDWEGPLPAFED